MPKFFDADGNEIEGFTQEDLDAKIAEALEKAKNEESFKNEPPKEEGAEVSGEDDRVAKLEQALEGLQSTLRTRDVRDRARALVGDDAEKIAEFETAFGRLSGFEATEEGFNQHIEAAAKLAGIDASVDMTGMGQGGAGRITLAKPDEKIGEGLGELAKNLGITAEDITKANGTTKE